MTGAFVTERGYCTGTECRSTGEGKKDYCQ